MEKLPDIKRNIVPSALSVRREMAQEPEALAGLTQTEKAIFLASTKLTIGEMELGMLTGKAAKLFRFIAMDIGYNIPADREAWAYTQTRLVDILRRYYYHMTLSDVKLAFELAVIGELDDYLPRDSHGQPDRKHYQQFNADYLARILNAYSRRQQDVITKAKELAPERPALPPSQEEKEESLKECKRITGEALARYERTGKLEFAICEDMVIYNYLLDAGMITEEEVTEADREAAYSDYLRRIKAGVVNQYTGMAVKRKGAESEEVTPGAVIEAQRRAIKKAFDNIIMRRKNENREEKNENDDKVHQRLHDRR